MADNQTDKLLEEASTNEDGSEITKKGLSKPTLIKIAIGVLSLLIISATAYFFFMSSDKPSQQETSVESIEDSAAEEDDGTLLETAALNEDPLSKKIQLLELREAAITLKEENLRMKERLMELEGVENLNNAETSVAEDGEKAINSDTAPKAKVKAINGDTAPEAKVKPKSQYSNLYTRNNSQVRGANAEPPPEPKWGKFDPLYNGK
jgi:uncharacterized membrane protein YvbJ